MRQYHVGPEPLRWLHDRLSGRGRLLEWSLLHELPDGSDELQRSVCRPERQLLPLRRVQLGLQRRPDMRVRHLRVYPGSDPGALRRGVRRRSFERDQLRILRRRLSHRASLFERRVRDRVYYGAVRLRQCLRRPRDGQRRLWSVRDHLRQWDPVHGRAMPLSGRALELRDGVCRRTGGQLQLWRLRREMRGRHIVPEWIVSVFERRHAMRGSVHGDPE